MTLILTLLSAENRCMLLDYHIHFKVFLMSHLSVSHLSDPHLACFASILSVINLSEFT